MNEQQKQAFQTAAQPLMDYLRSNHHPHVTVIIDSERAQLVEGLTTAQNVNPPQG